MPNDLKELMTQIQETLKIYDGKIENVSFRLQEEYSHQHLYFDGVQKLHLKTPDLAGKDLLCLLRKSYKQITELQKRLDEYEARIERLREIKIDLSRLDFPKERIRGVEISINVMTEGE